MRPRCLLLLFLTTVLWQTPARADDEPRERHFYFGRDYGSQALYSPLYVFLNRGFDVLQLRPQNRNLGAQNYLVDMRNVVDNVRNPFAAIEVNGWGRFSSQELLPLSFTPTTARWAPNYSLHLIGGGQSYAAMREWFLDHDADSIAATGLSIGTLFAAGFVNEALENKGVVGTNTDALADLYVFDVAGILLFSIEPVRWFFHHCVVLSDWSLQPTLTYPHGNIENTGSYYALKWPIPFAPRLRLFAYMGFSTMGGLSWKFDRGLSLSVAGGAKVGYFENIGGAADVENVVKLVPAGGLFLDRHESLLASVQVADVSDYTFHMNVYPNVLVHADPGLGTWTAVGKDGRFIVGITFAKALGLGIGAGTR